MIKIVKKVRTLANRGFTLLELMVSIGIMLVILSVILFSHRQFSDSLIITNLAYEVALSIRQSQTYGFSVKGVVDNGAQTFDAGYGVHFDGANNLSSYQLFADKNNNKIYDSDDINLETFNLERGSVVENICIISEGDCDVASGVVDIVFVRPNPDAFIRVGGGNTNEQGLVIKLRSSNGMNRCVELMNTGQISIKNCVSGEVVE